MESVSQACQPLWYFFLGIYPPISQSKVSPTTGKVFPCKTACSVVFDDFDEFKVPVQTENMPSLLYSIHDSNYCGHCFTSAKFSTLVSLTQNYFLFTQNVLHRSPQAESLHTKCVDDPQTVFEHTVHLIMQPFEGYKTNHVNWNKARVFHYRKCQQLWCYSAADIK